MEDIWQFEVHVIEKKLIIGLYFFLKCVPYGPVNNTPALVQLTRYHPNWLYIFHNFKPQTTFAVSLLLYNTWSTSHNMMSCLLLVVMNANASWDFLISIINLHLLSRNFSELKLPPPLFYVVILFIWQFISWSLRVRIFTLIRRSADLAGLHSLIMASNWQVRYMYWAPMWIEDMYGYHSLDRDIKIVHTYFTVSIFIVSK